MISSPKAQSSKNSIDTYEPEMDRFLYYYRSVQLYLKSEPLIHDNDQNYTPHLVNLSSQQLQLLLKDVSMEIIRRQEGLLPMYLKTDHLISNNLLGKKYISEIDSKSFRILAHNLLHVFKNKYPHLMDSIEKHDPNITVLSASFNQDGEIINDISPNILSKNTRTEKVRPKKSDQTLNSAFESLIDSNQEKKLNKNLKLHKIDSIYESEAQIRVAYQRIKELENALKNAIGIKESQSIDSKEMFSLIEMNQKLSEENDNLKKNESQLKQKLQKTENELRNAKAIKPTKDIQPTTPIKKVNNHPMWYDNSYPTVIPYASKTGYLQISDGEISHLKKCIDDLLTAVKSQNSTQVLSATQKIVTSYRPVVKQLGDIKHSSEIHTLEEKNKYDNLGITISKNLKLILSCSKSYSLNPDPSLVYQYESLMDSLTNYTSQIEKLRASQPNQTTNKSIKFVHNSNQNDLKISVTDFGCNSDDDKLPETPVTNHLDSANIYTLDTLEFSPLHLHEVHAIRTI